MRIFNPRAFLDDAEFYDVANTLRDGIPQAAIAITVADSELAHKYQNFHEEILCLLDTNSEDFCARFTTLINSHNQSPASCLLLGFYLPNLEINLVGLCSDFARDLALGLKAALAAGVICSPLTAKQRLVEVARHDPLRPQVHPGGIAGSSRDPHGILFDPRDGSVIIHYQQNPYAAGWGASICWGAYRIKQDGGCEQFETSLIPGADYLHYFSGSIYPSTITDSVPPAAYITAVTLDSAFWGVPDIARMRSTPDLSDGGRQLIWQQQIPQVVLDDNDFPDQQLKKIRDLRDPYVTEIDGVFYLLLGGRITPAQSRYRDRQGQAIATLSQTSETDEAGYPVNFSYVGNIFADQNDFAAGGAGILECPSLLKLNSASGELSRNLLIFCLQRVDGKLAGRACSETIEAVSGQLKGGQIADQQKTLLDYNSYNLVFAPTAVALPEQYEALLVVWIRLSNNQQGWCGIHSLRTIKLGEAGQVLQRPHQSIYALAGQSLSQDPAGYYRPGTSQYLFEATILRDQFENSVLNMEFSDNPEFDRAASLQITRHQLSASFDNAVIDLSPEPDFAGQIELVIVVDRTVLEIYVNGKVLTTTAGVINPEELLDFAQYFRFNQPAGYSFTLRQLRSAN